MRQITKDARDAFMEGRSWKRGNTKVSKKWGNYWVMTLFGNDIAYRNIRDGYISITNCGYFTNVTKERLNALPDISITQRNYMLFITWYLNGVEWDGLVYTIIPSTSYEERLLRKMNINENIPQIIKDRIIKQYTV